MGFIGWMIVTCEILFWVFIVLGLVTRYILKKNTLSLILLSLSPLVDLLLLILTSVDLYQGAVATYAHALAAVYIGVSVAFGKSMVKWADERFQYYVLKNGVKPSKHYGRKHASEQLKGWVKHLVAYLIGVSMLLIMIYLINNPLRTEALNAVMKIWSMALTIDLLISISYIVWPKKESSPSKKL
ncbi:hypothetical protein ACFYKX_20205 [Cytobacillus sp. FJAT-54145]|uniref:YmcC n=1 Tax=Cytobacillus spartinae TaxID=3299023 RepID=A0ABW6KFF8_9BACI